MRKNSKAKLIGRKFWFVERSYGYIQKNELKAIGQRLRYFFAMYTLYHMQHEEQIFEEIDDLIISAKKIKLPANEQIAFEDYYDYLFIRPIGSKRKMKRAEKSLYYKGEDLAMISRNAESRSEAVIHLKDIMAELCTDLAADDYKGFAYYANKQP